MATSLLLAFLAPVAALVRALSVPVHPVYFPVPLVPFLHATRISLAFRGQKARLGTKLSRGADMAGFLTMVRPLSRSFDQ